MMSSQNSLAKVLDKKIRGERITMLTAYDYPLAVILDRAGVDLILVGDSLANVVLGLDATTQVGMPEMLLHTRAVLRAVKRAPVIADLPFSAYQPAGVDALVSAREFIAAGCAAVKVEWFDRCLEVVRVLRAGGVEAMGHVGLTPQTAEKMMVQGRSESDARRILEQSRLLEAAGCCSLVIECVPESLARQVTRSLKIPVIGIGAGCECDGQVLVVHDMLGLNNRKVPKFVKKYANLSGEIERAVRDYCQDVVNGTFPASDQTFQ